MPRSRALALVGLLAVAAVAVMLLQSRLTVAQAGVRIAVAVGVLVLVDRVGLPLARSLVGERRPPDAT